MPASSECVLYQTDIKPEWLDYNNHLNVANYVLIFDNAGIAFFDHLGMGEAYTRETGGSWAVLESHVTYPRELLLGERVEVRTRIIDFDAKRLHLYHEIHKVGEDGKACSTCEQMTIFFDLNTRKSAPFPNHVFQKIQHIAQDQKVLAPPSVLGRVMGIKK